MSNSWRPFALDASVPNSVRSPNLRSTFDHPPTNGEHSTNQEKENAAVSTQKRGLAALPQPGDELAGFRIITELGRGAFRASTSPKKSTWAGGLWPSRFRGPMATNRRFSPDFSTPILCRYTPFATTPRADCASCACPISGRRPFESSQDCRWTCSDTSQWCEPGRSPRSSQPETSRLLNRCPDSQASSYVPCVESQTGAGGFPAGGIDRKP